MKLMWWGSLLRKCFLRRWHALTYIEHIAECQVQTSCSIKVVLSERIGSLRVHLGLVYNPCVPREHFDSKEETLQETFLGSAITGEIFIGEGREDKRRGVGCAEHPPRSPPILTFPRKSLSLEPLATTHLWAFTEWETHSWALHDFHSAEPAFEDYSPTRWSPTEIKCWKRKKIGAWGKG